MTRSVNPKGKLRSSEVILPGAPLAGPVSGPLSNESAAEPFTYLADATPADRKLAPIAGFADPASPRAVNAADLIERDPVPSMDSHASVPKVLFQGIEATYDHCFPLGRMDVEVMEVRAGRDQFTADRRRQSIQQAGIEGLPGRDGRFVRRHGWSGGSGHQGCSRPDGGLGESRENHESALTWV